MPSRIARYLQSSVSGVNLDETQHQTWRALTLAGAAC